MMMNCGRGMRLFFLATVFISICHIVGRAQSFNINEGLPVNHPWVDSVFETLSQEARISQLIWPMVEQLQNPQWVTKNLEMVRRYQPGGVLFMKNSAGAIALFNDSAHALSAVPLLTAIDGEWGLAMRVEAIQAYPKAMTLGAIENDKLIYAMGLDVANQLRQLGLNVNFAPVADVNCNPLNPVIGVRSFGQNPLTVAQRSVLYMLGLQSGGVMAVAKHFPGHGDTQTDSHAELPLLNHNRSRFDSLELVPFNALIKNGIYGVMTAHLEIPQLDSVKGRPSSLSPRIVNDLLKMQLGFSGLVITDAMNMKGVKVAGKPGRVDALALIAGNDVVEASENIGLAIDEIKLAILNGELTWEAIDNKCRRVLAMKYVLGATRYTPVSKENIAQQINLKTNTALIQQMFDESLTVLKHSFGDASVSGSDTVAVMLMGHQKAWRDSLVKNANVVVVDVKAGMQPAQIAKVKDVVAKYDRVVWIADNQAATRAAWSDVQLAKIRSNLVEAGSFCLVFAGSPYQIKKYSGAIELPNLVLVYEDVPFAASTVARFLKGGMVSKGKLPVDLNSIYKEGAGLSLQFRK